MWQCACIANFLSSFRQRWWLKKKTFWIAHLRCARAIFSFSSCVVSMCFPILFRSSRLPFLIDFLAAKPIFSLFFFFKQMSSLCWKELQTVLLTCMPWSWCCPGNTWCTRARTHTLINEIIHTTVAQSVWEICALLLPQGLQVFESGSLICSAWENAVWDLVHWG